MACYHPLDAWHHPTEKKPLLGYNPKLCHSTKPDFKLPCGRCVGCRLDRSRKWAIRCMHESKMHRDNCFITLTYSDEKLPSRPDGVAPANVSLFYEDFQLFMKRLRKKFVPPMPDFDLIEYAPYRREAIANWNQKYGIRFYMAGEYGDNFGRPHFHACLFNFDFPDRDFFSRTPSGANIYRSAILESLWPYGFSSVGDFTFESAAYVARYCMKKITGDPADDHYSWVDPDTGEVFWREPEFNRMSLKPGIGGSFFEKYKTDIFPHDHVIVNGKPVGVPRYYDKLYERIDDCGLFALETQIKPSRMKKAQLSVDDNTPERLEVKEQVARANLQRLKRKLL